MFRILDTFQFLIKFFCRIDADEVQIIIAFGSEDRFNFIALIFPQMSDTGLWLSLAVGVGIMVFVSILNALAIRRKVMGIWWRKER